MVRRFFAAALLVVALAGCGSDVGDLSQADPVAGSSSSQVSSTLPSTTTTMETTTTNNPTTSTLSDAEKTAAELEQHVSLIRGVYRHLSDISFGGLEEFNAALAEVVYPGFECSAEDYAAQTVDYPPDYRFEAIVAVDTIEPDPGWVIPPGTEASGEVAEGTVYIAQVTFTESSASGLIDPISSTSEVHITIIDGEAFVFMPCS